MSEIKADNVRQLLEHFAKSTYRAKSNDAKANEILKTCFGLFAHDYHFFVIDNSNGELSTHYPSQLIILEYEKTGQSGVPKNKEDEEDCLFQSLYDVTKLRDTCSRARFARCRARFPLPVILVDGKFVCRSATLSGGPEIYGRSGYHFIFSGGTSVDEEDDDEEIPVPQTSGEWQLFDKVRNQDIRLLKTLSVRYICDLMVEKKKVKFGMNITSSEKVDKERRYADFTILSLPYPGKLVPLRALLRGTKNNEMEVKSPDEMVSTHFEGCEFFREYLACGYAAEGLHFDWSQPFVDAHLVVPADAIAPQVDVDWGKYKSWDLVMLTQNYLKLLLNYVSSGNAGLLVHCISGWDRTPLFVSLLRLSLWADARVHRSLGPAEILYLTLAYDWFLFGHNLADRLSKGEEILFFCFDFLKHITGDEFSIRKRRAVSHPLRGDGEVADSLLLEAELVPNTHGSNTSLSSNCSSVSSRSQDCPPQFFTAHSFEGSDEVTLGHHTNGNSNTNLRAVPRQAYEGTKSTYTSTSPVAVPSNARNRSESSSSSVGCGSWQIISGTGSLRGSTSTTDSATPSSDTSRKSRSSFCSFPEVAEGTEPTCGFGTRKAKHPQRRHERLQAVRTMFHNVYNSSTALRLRGAPAESSPSSSGAFAGLLETVGILSARNPT